jgi:hypothetical protein
LNKRINPLLSPFPSTSDLLNWRLEVSL